MVTIEPLATTGLADFTSRHRNRGRATHPASGSMSNRCLSKA